MGTPGRRLATVGHAAHPGSFDASCHVIIDCEVLSMRPTQYGAPSIYSGDDVVQAFGACSAVPYGLAGH